MELFRIENSSYSDNDLAKALDAFGLNGRTVLCYSRLLSFGMLTGREAAARLLGRPAGGRWAEWHDLRPLLHLQRLQERGLQPSVLAERGRRAGRGGKDVARLRAHHSSHILQRLPRSQFRLLEHPEPPHMLRRELLFRSVHQDSERLRAFSWASTSAPRRSSTTTTRGSKRMGRFVKKFNARIAGTDGVERDIEFDSFCQGLRLL